MLLKNICWHGETFISQAMNIIYLAFVWKKKKAWRKFLNRYQDANNDYFGCGIKVNVFL